MDARTRRFLRNATILWCVVPFVAFVAAPPGPLFCAPGETGMYWFNALVIGAMLTFPLCFPALMFSRIAFELGYERAARALMFMPLIGIGAYWLIVLGLRAYWGDAISCLVVMKIPHT